MPMRYPSGTDPDVSSVGSTPTDQFRSPEDDLKLWQYLTVYWMYPIIAKGQIRKLNEDDVWQLPYMQHHRQLFEAFQVLTGGVIGRVIYANAMDVVILTSLSLVDSLCSKYESSLGSSHSKVSYSVCKPNTASTTSEGNGNTFGFFHESCGHVCHVVLHCSLDQNPRGDDIVMVQKTLLRKMQGRNDYNGLHQSSFTQECIWKAK
jgi:hypothetical protein